MVDSLLREVQEDMAREKAEGIIIRHWKLLLASFIFLILCAVTYVWLQQHRKNKIYADASAFMEATTQLQSSKVLDVNGVMSKLQKLSLSDSNYAVMSKLYLAWLHDVKKEPEKAISIYGSISSDSSVDQTFRDFAAILSVNLKVRSKTISNKEAIDELDKYLETKPIYLYSAQILQASLCIQENMEDKAKEVLDKLLTDPSIGYNTRQTAVFLSTHLKVAN